MTALRFQTGEGGDIRYPRSPFGGTSEALMLDCMYYTGNNSYIVTQYVAHLKRIQVADGDGGEG